MNSQQFKKFKAEVPNFVKNHCFLVDPKKLSYDKNSSQIRANGHMVKKFKEIHTGDLARRLGFKYDGAEEEYVEAAAKRYRHEIYKNSGKDLDYFRRKVKKCLKTKVRSFYENYSKEQAFSFHNAQTKFSGKKAGDVSGNQVVYTFSETNHSTPAVIGHVASKVIDNPGVKVTLIYHIGSLVGKNDQSIFNERKKIEDWYDKVNNAHGWFNELYFLPQIKQGVNQENMFTLIKSR